VNKKVKPLLSLKKTLRQFKRKNKKIVFTNGCFDILHRGHVEYLRKAKSLGDILIVGINSDASVKKLKGKGRPINTQGDRAKILASLEFIDFVTIFGEETPFKLINEVRPDILVKGGDWKTEEIVGGNIVKSYGGRVAVIKYLKGYSTTKLLNAIKKRI